MRVKVAIVQLNTTTRDEVLESVGKAVENFRADLYVLPELVTTGYKDVLLNAEDLEGRTVSFFRKLARDADAAFAFSFARKDGEGNVRNTAVFIDKNGELASLYDKVHLFLPLGEGEIFAAGDKIKAFEALGDLKLGLQICYDLRFPEAFRKLALEGVKIILVPAQWPLVRIEVWNSLLVARAAENGVFVIGSNRVGEERGTVYGGNSAVVSPSGEVLIRLGRREAVGVVEIDTDEVDEVRKRINVLGDRRPEIYESPK